MTTVEVHLLHTHLSNYVSICRLWLTRQKRTRARKSLQEEKEKQMAAYMVSCRRPSILWVFEENAPMIQVSLPSLLQAFYRQKMRIIQVRAWKCVHLCSYTCLCMYIFVCHCTFMYAFVCDTVCNEMYIWSKSEKACLVQYVLFLLQSVCMCVFYVYTIYTICMHTWLKEWPYMNLLTTILMMMNWYNL